jgi:hypothetical protein
MNNKLRKAIYIAASALMLHGLVFSSPSSGAATDTTRAVRTSAKTAPTPAPAALPQASEVEVTESGDPDAPGETFIINERALHDALIVSPELAAFPTEQTKYKDARRVVERMLDYALEMANRDPPVSRQNSPGQIKKFVGLFDYRSEQTAFCAMGIAYAAAKAFCDLTPERVPYTRRNDTRTFKTVLPLINKYYFPPSASCRFMMKEAKKRRPTQRGGWIAKGTRTPKRGWLVLFDWKNRGDGIPDHVGIVNGVGRGGALYTVEFNTSIASGSQRNGGAVAEKVRSPRDVLGFIRTY